jgi:hypothetical protein
MNPLVSVVVTTYNQAPYIQQALQSVFDQTYPNFEVIVVDDGSTDDTPARLMPFMDRIVYVRQKNQGIAVSRNAGIRRASGEFVALLDGDDLWEPQKLSIQVAAALNYRNTGMIVVDGIMFSEDRILRDSLLGKLTRELPEDSTSSLFLYETLLRGCFIGSTSQVMIPAKVFGVVGLSDAKFKLSSDYDLYLRIAGRYEITVIRKRLARWRYHEMSASGPMQLRGFRWAQDDIEILKKHLPESPEIYKAVIRNRLHQRCWQLGSYYLHCNRLEEARSWFLRSATYSPFSLRTWVYVTLSLLPIPMLEAIRCVTRWGRGSHVVMPDTAG